MSKSLRRRLAALERRNAHGIEAVIRALSNEERALKSGDSDAIYRAGVESERVLSSLDPELVRALEELESDAIRRGLRPRALEPLADS